LSVYDLNAFMLAIVILFFDDLEGLILATGYRALAMSELVLLRDTGLSSGLS
jgi:hypothetical protein